MDILKRLTFKNLKLNKKRTIVTTVGIILSVALLAALSTLAFSFWESFIVEEKMTNGEYHSMFYGANEKTIERIDNNVKVEAAYKVSLVGIGKLEGCKNESKPYIQVFAGDETSLKGMYFNLRLGRYPENDSEIVISRHMDTNGGVEYKVGDKITLNLGERVVDEPYEDLYEDDFSGEIIAGDHEFDGSDMDEDTDEIFGKKYEKGDMIPYGEMYEAHGSEKIVNEKTYTYTIVGIMERPSHNVEEYDNPAYTAITYSDSLLDGYKQVGVKLSKEGLKDYQRVICGIMNWDYESYVRIMEGDYELDELDDLYSKLVENAKDNPECGVNIKESLILLECPSFNSNNGMFRSLISLSLIVAAIIIATSVYCIKNSFDISVTEKIRQFGMLASVGATKKQIRKAVIYEGFLIGIIAIPIGLFCGAFAAWVLIKVCNYILAEMITFDLVFKFSIVAMGIAVILGAFTIYLSALGSAIKASKVSPIVAIRNQQDIKIKSKKIKAPKIIKKIWGMGGVVSYKNMKRNKRKYRTTVISIVICVAIYIGISYFISLGMSEMGTMYTEVKYNVEASLSEQDIDREDLIKKINEIEGYDKYYEAREYFGYIAGNVLTDDYLENIYTSQGYETANEFLKSEDAKYIDLIFYVMSDDDFAEYAKNVGSYTSKDGIIIMNYNKTNVYDEDGNRQIKLMRCIDLDGGDKITLRFPVKSNQAVIDDEDEQVNEVYEERTFEILAATKERPVIESDSWGRPLAYVSESYWNKVVADIDFINGTYEYFYFVTDNADKLQDNLEKFFAEEYEDEYFIYNVDKEAKESKSIVLLFSIFAYGLITVIALIGITNIVNTLSTSMELRAREFAMLKSVGMTSKEFNRMVRLETLFIGMKSVIIGLPLGTIISLLLYRTEITGGMIMDYEFPLVACIVCLAVVFLLLFIIMSFSLKKINNRNIIETIKDETT